MNKILGILLIVFFVWQIYEVLVTFLAWLIDEAHKYDE